MENIVTLFAKAHSMLEEN